MKNNKGKNPLKIKILKSSTLGKGSASLNTDILAPISESMVIAEVSVRILEIIILETVKEF